MVALLVVATILVFLAADLVIQALYSRTRAGVAKPLTLVHPDALQWEMRHPDGVFLSSGHAWAALEPNGSMRVGMDDFARQMIGPVDTMDLPKVGTKVRAGEPLVRLYKGASLANLAAPVDGEVCDVHTGLALNTTPVRRDPYGEGWMVLLKPENLSKGLSRLSVAEEARTFLGEEVRRFRGFLTSYEPALAQAADGGSPVPGIAAELGPQAWDQFRREFLGENI
jgi:glycine cleavage system H lipoate-binding protein